MNNEYNKYDVIWAWFPGYGSVQAGYRPGIIIQNDIGNKFSPTLIAIPLTKQLKKLDQPTHTVIKRDKSNGLEYNSMLLAEQIATINKDNVEKIGRVTDRDTQKAIFRCFINLSAFGNEDSDLKDLNELKV